MASPPAYTSTLSSTSSVAVSKSGNGRSSGDNVKNKLHYKGDIADARATRDHCLEMLEEFSDEIPEKYRAEWTTLMDHYRELSRAIDCYASKKARTKGTTPWYRLDTKLTLRKEFERAAALLKFEFDVIEERIERVSRRATREDRLMQAGGLDPVEHDASSFMIRTLLTAEDLKLVDSEAEKLARAERHEKKKALGAQNITSSASPSPVSDPAMPIPTRDATEEVGDVNTDDMSDIVTTEQNDGILMEYRKEGVAVISMTCKRIEAGDVDEEINPSPTHDSPTPVEARSSWSDSRSSMTSR